MPTNADLLRRREQLLGTNVPTFYDEPVHIVRGERTWLWDAAGKKYLDCYNNVPHVGHCHPKVVEAIHRQAATLNTHTRYLHEGILDYAERLIGKFDPHLSSAMMVCSGSEANDVALRMAQSHTGNMGIICTDNTYHGNTALVSQIGSRTEPIGGYSRYVRAIPSPVGTETGYEPVNPNECDTLATIVEQEINQLQHDGFGLAALILCPYFANEGFPTLQPGFLDSVAEKVRKAGGLIIADEVQPGFGRIGTHWWGHHKIGIKPDIVTLGKPMGNGFPVASVVTSHDIMCQFRERFRYFNTFGGNPVAMEAAMATMEVIEDENLVSNALDMGRLASDGLKELSQKFECLGTVRGSGLFFGAEIVDETGSPDNEAARTITNRLKDAGVLINTSGRYGSLLKIRPPMPISADDVDFLLSALEEVLSKLTPSR